MPDYIFFKVTVRNATEWLALRCHRTSMPHSKAKKKLADAILASVAKEMAKPRVAKSAKIDDHPIKRRVPAKP
jgi:hypothetical protein